MSQSAEIAYLLKLCMSPLPRNLIVILSSISPLADIGLEKEVIVPFVNAIEPTLAPKSIRINGITPLFVLPL